MTWAQAQVNAFAELTGDHNPIHQDAAYAATTPFKRPIMHGMLSASVFSRILGTEFPGTGTIYLGQSLTFKAPMYVDTPYTVRLEITAHDPERHRATLHTEITSPEGKVTLTGEASVLHRERF
jgi:acyl dehydratase